MSKNVLLTGKTTILMYTDDRKLIYFQSDDGFFSMSVVSLTTKSGDRARRRRSGVPLEERPRHNDADGSITLRNHVVERLRDDLLGHVFQPGQSLREIKLAERYGVSRSPIREAFMQLTQEGLLVAVPNCGVKVAKFLEREVEPVVMASRLRIESFAAGKLIGRFDADPGVLVPLKEELDANRLACLGGSLPQIKKTDMEFHLRIVQCAGSDNLIKIWKSLVTVLLHKRGATKNPLQEYEENLAVYISVVKKSRPAVIRSLRANICAPAN
jgi:GntR family transcriptional regulator, rspAB operon transcriptional repressor